MNISKTLCHAVMGIAVLGLVFATTAFAKGPFATNESWSSCNGSLCIDAPPEGPNGLDGSGGWGWNSSTNSPVTTLTVGIPASFTVTVLQPGSVPACGSGTGTITLTYSSQDFNLNATDSRENTGSDPFDRGAVETFTYTGDFWCHKDQSVAFTFTPQNPTFTALVTRQRLTWVASKCPKPSRLGSWHLATKGAPAGDSVTRQCARRRENGAARQGRSPQPSSAKGRPGKLAFGAELPLSTRHDRPPPAPD